MEFQFISVDVFQTLVDVPSIKEKVCNIYLKDRYSAVIAEKVWHFMTERMINYFLKVVVEAREFETVKFAFSRYFQEAFQKFDIEFDHNEAAKILAHQHNYAVPYNDTAEFLSFLDNNYIYFISTDADNDMISDMNHLENSDKIFTSENLRKYKMSKDNGFFRSILDYYQVDPKKILHIGDSVADIVNPKRLGIKTCWINRTNAAWQHEIEPDYSYSDLASVLRIL